MSDFAGAAPPQPNFNQSSAFAAALQRAKQIAAKINPAGGGSTPGESRPKRPLDDSPEPDAKKGPGVGGPPPMGGMGMGRSSLGAPPPMSSMNNGPPGMNDDLKPPGSGGGGGGGGGGSGGGGGGPRMGGGGPGGGRNSVEIMLPGPKVGLIIGKGGETIKQLQEKSGAKMVVIQDGPAQELEKPLVISGDPQKVEYAKQLVYELMAEKEMKNFGNRGGGGGGRGGRNDSFRGGGGGGYDDGFGGGGGGGGGADYEVLVPKAAVGVVIGKGGDMIKKIQSETGCRVQFQQARDEGPGDRRCSLSGNPKQIDHARQKIEELIDSVMQRDGSDGMGGGPGGFGGGGRGGRGGGRGGRGGRGGHFGGDRNGGGGGGDYGSGGWNDRGGNSNQHEVSFVVPANKCGIIIGKGGETIKQINQQSGAYCELDRRSNANTVEKTFTIKGDPDSVEAAKRIISEKIQLPLNFVTMNGPSGGMNNSMPTAYPGMAPQGYNPQGWGMPNYGQQQQQQWGGAPSQGGDASNGQNAAPPSGAPSGPVQMNPSSGQPDYSLQWAEYYRSLGMHREAEMIEQQAKTKSAGGAPPGGAPAAPQGGAPAAPAAADPSAGAAGGGQADYSTQWAAYYRSMGKIKEAEAIEAQMKNKAAGAAPAAPAAPTPAAPGAPAAGFQQPYGGYQQQNAYYGGQGQPGGQQNYGFPQYGYGGQAASAPQNQSDGN
ncbi:far upstream element-binding protein 2-like isoform X2 [Anthonomus grandis grandis]|uniref:far upstream element-binding protein 2-like isoform X2 n=1 Tax=Anthonomus grandis grandis TaxID=2921223 RepID=UPI0021657DAF|nr:far upstream element-binding protein 2-like isoform X2 [Anthonomus grandis grandis]